jgi:hypothetical protein
MSIDSDLATLNSVLAKNSGPSVTNAAGAIAAMKAAGNGAVVSIGPAIDSFSGGSSQVMALTQRAWVMNGGLAQVNDGPSASSDDVATAASQLKLMADQ